MKAVDRIDYDANRYTVLLVDTSEKKGKYGQMLRKWGAKVLDLDWSQKTEHPIQMLARARELYRVEAWKHKFDYILHLDTDVLMPRDGLKRLLSHNKDQVGFVVHAFFTRKGFDRVYGRFKKKHNLKYKDFESKPAVFKSGQIWLQGSGKEGMDYFSWKELKAAKGKTVKVYASSIACLLVKKKVYSTIPFRTHPTFVNGEDLWYYAEADEKGFEAWCDTSVRAVHLNASWELVAARTGRKLLFSVGVGDLKHPKWKKIERMVKKGKAHIAAVEVEQRGK